LEPATITVSFRQSPDRPSWAETWKSEGRSSIIPQALPLCALFTVMPLGDALSTPVSSARRNQHTGEHKQRLFTGPSLSQVDD
jgi:hypothetical protein